MSYAQLHFEFCPAPPRACDQATYRAVLVKMHSVTSTPLNQCGLKLALFRVLEDVQCGLIV